MLARLLEDAPDYTIENGQVTLVSETQAVASLELVIGDKRGFGVGSMKNPDLDMAVKTAVSEAIKNAAKNGFGIALELWSEEHREGLARQRKVGGSVAAMKREVFRIASEKLGKAPEKAAEVAKVFGVKVADLTDEATLRKILTEEGVL